MSAHHLKRGDRVRLTVQNRMRGYHPGDKGLLVRELASDSSGTRYYLVRMEKDDPSKTGVVVTADEIEFVNDARSAP